ncbi:MAG: hypothetical protein V2J16_11450 [Thermoleophilia bacterium]|nr:hypothetical protein [Thermoleophilia bacterium]
MDHHVAAEDGCRRLRCVGVYQLIVADDGLASPAPDLDAQPVDTAAAGERAVSDFEAMLGRAEQASRDPDR